MIIIVQVARTTRKVDHGSGFMGHEARGDATYRTGPTGQVR